MIGTLYTFLSFALSFFFLHLATMFWFHQTGFSFLTSIDQSRMSIHQQSAITNLGSFQEILLRDNVFYFIITLVVLSIWILNMNLQYNKNNV